MVKGFDTTVTAFRFDEIFGTVLPKAITTTNT
jgi:hypothetical protein